MTLMKLKISKNPVAAPVRRARNDKAEAFSRNIRRLVEDLKDDKARLAEVVERHWRQRVQETASGPVRATPEALRLNALLQEQVQVELMMDDTGQQFVQVLQRIIDRLEAIAPPTRRRVKK